MGYGRADGEERAGGGEGFAKVRAVDQLVVGETDSSLGILHPFWWFCRVG
jgi:hypothetical protein